MLVDTWHWYFFLFVCVFYTELWKTYFPHWVLSFGTVFFSFISKYFSYSLMQVLKSNDVDATHVSYCLRKLLTITSMNWWPAWKVTASLVKCQGRLNILPNIQGTKGKRWQLCRWWWKSLPSVHLVELCGANISSSGEYRGKNTFQAN